MRLRALSSIEDRAGVDDPNYQPPDDPDEFDDQPEPHELGVLEAIIGFLVPIVGLLLAVWRFGRNDIGPGLALLLLAILGAAAYAVLFAT